MRELGRGGMGTVDLAYQLDMEREVALKRIRPESVGHVAAEGWFKREYRALAAIRHPGVPAVHDCGRSDDGVAYFTMERIDGPSLADALKTRRFEPVEALTTVIELGRILAAAHAAGVVHRDVKPANVVLEAGGRVRLIDFGICFFLPKFKAARNLRSVGAADFETGPLEIAGSAGYTDPAIMTGEYSPSVQSDIFSMCAVLYEMLTGRRLYDDRALSFRAIDSGELAPELAFAVTEIRRGSQLLPRDRHASVDELVRNLEIARSTVLRARSSAGTHRSRTLFLGLSVANLVVLVTLAVSWNASREPAAAPGVPVSPIEPEFAGTIERVPAPIEPAVVEPQQRPVATPTAAVGASNTAGATSKAPRSTRRGKSFLQVMRGLEASVGDCIARTTGKEPARAIDVRVRFAASTGQIDQVRVVDMSATNPIAGCVDQVVRGAAPPPADRPNPTYTFFANKRTTSK